MPLKTLYFDESGYTGSNLLDPDQPIFAIASSDLDDAAAEAILKNSFRYRGREFKFSSIWGSSNRSDLVRFGRALDGMHEHAFTWMMDKRFVLLTKIVDMLVEPYITNSGFDFYSDGFCWKSSNYIHFGLAQFAEATFYETLLNTYLTFSRDPTPEALSVLQFQLRIMANSSEEPVKVLVDQMALGAELFLQYHSFESYRGSNELHVSSLVAVIVHWRQRHPEDFAVIHDASANFFRRRDTWERITSPNVPQEVHALGDGSDVEYPLRVVSTTPMNSIDSRAIQLCDMLAEYTARNFDPRLTPDERALLDNTIRAGLGEMVFIFGSHHKE